MRKITLVCALFVAMAVSAKVTIKVEKLWESSDLLPASTEARQGVGYDGKVLVQDKANKTVWAFAKEGEAVTRTEFVKNDDFDAVGIAADNVGNLVVLKGWAGSNPSTATLVNAKDKTCKSITFTLPKQEGATAIGRTDYVFASGNLFSEEGGYIYMYPNTQPAIYGIKVANGEVVNVEAIGSGWTAGTSLSTIILDNYGNIYAQARSAAWQKWDVIESKLVTVNIEGIKNSTVGGCAFTIGGKDLIAYNAGKTNYNSEWNLYNLTDESSINSEPLYIIKKDAAPATAFANWLSAQKIDEKTYNIYQYCPGIGVGMWQVTAEGDAPTSVEDTEVAQPMQKIIRDGQVLIMRRDKMYNIMGVEVQ